MSKRLLQMTTSKRCYEWIVGKGPNSVQQRKSGRKMWKEEEKAVIPKIGAWRQ
jgi:hypothetical protein